MAKKKTPAKEPSKWLTPAVIVALITTIGVVVVALIEILPIFINPTDTPSATVEVGMYEILIHVEDENKEPLSGVLVTLQPRGPNPPSTMYTDNLGNAIMEYESKYEGGLADISVHSESYAPFNQTITLYEDSPPINIQLK